MKAMEGTSFHNAYTQKGKQQREMFSLYGTGETDT